MVNASCRIRARVDRITDVTFVALRAVTSGLLFGTNVLIEAYFAARSNACTELNFTRHYSSAVGLTFVIKWKLQMSAEGETISEAAQGRNEEAAR